MFSPVECTPIEPQEFNQLCAGARVLEADWRGEKVLLTPDDRIIKLFYPRRRITSARIYPYAFRFWNNARHLRAKAIPTVHCEQLRYDATHGRYLVTYPLLSGTILREGLESGVFDAAQLDGLAAFLARLHQLGILFRSIHLGNILVLEKGDFGLIDIADMSIRSRSLGLFARARNFRHLLHDRRDRTVLGAFGYGRLLERYETAANLTGWRKKRLRLFIRRCAPAMKF
jgi:hypothetical protein